jgi:glycosyltransferase involved in cell wall biosynthesis
MPEFAIITPTIGRQVLKRCLMTMEHQVHKDYVQIVVGDGPQEPWVAQECDRPHIKFVETTKKESFYGTEPRNAALKLIESGQFGDVGYVLFVDDDNLLLEPALYNLHLTIQSYGRPPLLWHEILFTNKYKTTYYVLPKCGEPVKDGDWDSLSGAYRADVISGLRWKAIYNHDLIYAMEAGLRAGGAPWVKCEGIGAVHCLSWDTYDQRPPS